MDRVEDSGSLDDSSNLSGGTSDIIIGSGGVT